jgi:hypothetical protein
MSTREPSVAGTFYPESPQELQRFCNQVILPSTPLAEARAVILPHAGYIYSGETAGKVLSQVKIPEKIFLIGPNHRGYGSDFAVAAKGEWKTPLGRVPIDEDLASRFLEASHDLVHDEEAHRFEHSLEVEVPLLQTKNPGVKIVPLIVGTLDLEQAHSVAAACGELLSNQKEPVLIVTSTDMNHYENDRDTRIKDRFALDAIEHLDAEALAKAIAKYNITMCGFVPVYMLLVMSRQMGIKKATLVDYRTSANVSGDYDRVVGYAGFILQ